MTTYFEKRGKENTEETARLALARAKEAGINHIVVASNTGFTAKHFVNRGIHVVCVTHHVGFKSPGLDEMSPEMRKELREAGVDVLTTTHLFGNVERAITQRQAASIRADYLRYSAHVFSGSKGRTGDRHNGFGCRPHPLRKPVIAVGGSGGGADSAVVVLPSHAKTFFETQVLELICKPRNTRN